MDTARRLRDVAAPSATSTPAATACRDIDATAAAVIPELTQDALVELDADLADRFRACPAYTTEMVR